MDAVSNQFAAAARPRAAVASTVGFAVAACLGAAWRRLECGLDRAERRRQRRQLMRLDERTLGDLGLSRCDAVAEWSKPVRQD